SLFQGHPVGAQVHGLVRSRSMLNFTATASSGVPSENLSPGRNRIASERPESTISYPLASTPSMRDVPDSSVASWKSPPKMAFIWLMFARAVVFVAGSSPAGHEPPHSDASSTTA